MSSSQVDVAQKGHSNQWIAKVLGLSREEVDAWKVSEDPDQSVEGIIFGDIITFSPDTPREILDKAGAEEGEFSVIISELYNPEDQ